jgi:hypothetical protein
LELRPPSSGGHGLPIFLPGQVFWNGQHKVGFGGWPFHSSPPVEREEIAVMKQTAFVTSGVRTPKARLLALALCLSLLGLTVLLGAGCSDEKKTATYPPPPPTTPNNWLYDIGGTAANDIYACGEKGVIFHSTDGVTWTAQDLGVDAPIVALHEDGSTLYAVGHGGRVWRNTSGSWEALSSGTSENLYGVGKFGDDIYICGANGTLLRNNGSSWESTPTVMVTRDPATFAPLDTLSLAEDVESLLTVNTFFVGGAYRLPDYEGEDYGMLGTDGMVLASDPQYDWLLRPLRGDELAPAEWVLCTTSDPLNLSRNYLGTSEGWVFQLLQDEEIGLVWSKRFPRITADPLSGIRDMWIDENDFLYMVTDDGQLVVQSEDYNFDDRTGFRKELYDQNASLVGIWGTGSDNIYMVGLMENKILHTAVDLSDTTLAAVEEIPVTFPAKSAGYADAFVDEIGRPRF